MMISSLILADLGVVAIPVSNHKIIFQLLAEFKLSKTWDNLNLLRMHLSKEKLTGTPDDDGTACAPITKQPASDNPFLKNHKIQMKPNYYPEGFFDDNKVSSTNFYKVRKRKTYISLSYDISMHEHDITYVDVDKNYGAKATTNAWEPKINKQNEFIFSQIWLLSDLFRQYLISIEAG
ncbi:hypothetical protein DY000_02054038 [Brassica cretica]|uniref:Neprosin PEP catalytic domain-containing protein n=1 Tax=Brassica cretica TaxID=69181 RepID=A0ABQ7ADC9_BRACR|nr:hypothetical protein DY000_02054038 [Brassica cretica]